MDREQLRPHVTETIEARNWASLRESLEQQPAPETAELLMELPKHEQVLLFRSLTRETAAAVFAHLDIEQQDALLHALTDEETRRLLTDMSPDDRTQLLEELPGRVTQRLLTLLPAEDLEEARWLLGYPEGSVGRLMTPDYIAVRPDWTIARALEHIRTHVRSSETADVIYVTDESWTLLDDIELRRFILTPPDAHVSDIMDNAWVSVLATADRQEAVRLIRRYDFVALPVVDSAGTLLGIVTVDDILDVQEQEATESFHKVASVGPLGMGLREATARVLYQKRVGWLLTLVFMNILSGAGIAIFEETLAATLSLAYFLPLLIGSGGNAGSQSATLMIRALALGDVRRSDWLQMLRRELLVAMLLGTTMAAGVALVALARAPEIVAVVVLAMVCIVVVGSIIGMLLPFIFTRFGMDPATASGPLVTSLADIAGVLLYFSIAQWILGGGLEGLL
jgi:magnesium transporter